MKFPSLGNGCGELEGLHLCLPGQALHKKYDAGELKCHGAHVIHYNVLVVTASCLAGITNSMSLWKSTQYANLFKYIEAE